MELWKSQSPPPLPGTTAPPEWAGSSIHVADLHELRFATPGNSGSRPRLEAGSDSEANAERPGKRPRGADSFSLDDPSESGLCHHRPRTVKVLACPFYRDDSQKYGVCQGYDLRRVKDVKQHITRKHQKPGFYCPRCYEVFPTRDFRDVHLRGLPCSVRADPRFDGINDEQKQSLAQCRSRGKTVEEQWYDMWDIIFPGKHRPRSAYLGNCLEEMIPALRGHWIDNRSEIIPRVLRTRQLDGVDNDSIDDIFSAFFACLERAASSGNADPKPVSHGLPMPSIAASSIHASSNHWDTFDARGHHPRESVIPTTGPDTEDSGATLPDLPPGVFDEGSLDLNFDFSELPTHSELLLTSMDQPITLNQEPRGSA